MDYSIVNVILRSIAVYALALILARIMGRKIISHMTLFDFIVGMSMGSLVANAMIGSESTFLSSIIALIVISTLSIGSAYLDTKSFKIRKLANSEPVTVVENGNIVEENMKNMKLTVNELMMKMREKNAFSLADVEFAIMETDGELSVLPKADKKPLTPSQMKIKTTNEGLMKDVIIDGEIIRENLKSAGVNEDWLHKELKKQNIEKINDVFYAGIYANEKLHVSKRNKNENHGQCGIE
ncbi:MULTISPECIES: YetF domain-containing protein [Clostridium]|uniref:YetF domain-containing protein n=1 Tax=Candidatus Clostridium helianthi TaxID=3381660 RepID=A0ABW8S5W7_9CLOT|nr:DUF421 domain-containing protein [Clostridium beijerinckii]MZK52195.1 DUF421 domain-containing protein [Clostridium beijerinckii]MZK60243.1 DUF421 domain-containing protein [Clostridium beijerinckii]MZK70575.1 DUF421 domain-containing protein [Clostridium beijerinckii]MZK75831.1 DUF421 domain-containing protein [Clostridium beijerinckii]MZK85567.1 DUF421 domain-containing protein [Clostridium beijerinckii]